MKTRFSEGTLRQIAEFTGGRYVRSSSGRELAGAIADIVKGERKLLVNLRQLLKKYVALCLWIMSSKVPATTKSAMATM